MKKAHIRMRIIVIIFLALGQCLEGQQTETFQHTTKVALNSLYLEPDYVSTKDWLLEGNEFEAGVYKNKANNELILSNGLIRRVFRLTPNAATVRLENLVTGESLLRGVKSEAKIKVDGVKYEVGGLEGQPNYAFLKPEWLDSMTADPASLKFTGFEVSDPEAPFEWKRVRHHMEGAQWPPKGMHLRMDYQMPNAKMTMSSDRLLPSEFGRALLYQTNFNVIDKTWQIHNSPSHERSSFENEGKIGQIYTPSNTAVFIEKLIDRDAKIIEANFFTGTDNSKEYGPGIALLWPEKTFKFYISPGGIDDQDENPIFKIWTGNEHLKGSSIKSKLDLGKSWALRIRITDAAVYCEARPTGGDWVTVKQLEPFKSIPTSVRIGKTNGKGESQDDLDEVGELIRMQVHDFSIYGAPESRNEEDTKDLKVSVHYELYDGIPVFAKWLTIENTGKTTVQIDHFTSEIIAAVEYGSAVETRKYNVPKPNIHVETDYAFSSFNVEDANGHVVHWKPDPEYLTQVNYLRLTPCLLEVHPEIGPARQLGQGEKFKTFRTFVLPHDSYDRERQGLALRKMYRKLAPWTTENPLMMHARFADWERVKIAIDQAAEVGFEMVILTFGSGFNIEDDSEQYLSKMKEYAQYAQSKGVELGGYSLLASRKIGNGQDVVMPEGQRPTFGNSPCIESEWGQQYFSTLYSFYQKTGFSLLEHDGSYPGDVCTSTEHPGHNGFEDSRWNQYETISGFYQWCRANGIYLNIPDYYYLTGGNKCGMGYREVNWSLPRNQQVIHTRQNIYDGAWQKTPSMGWMFVPLTEYHGGGAAATIEPLNEHLDHYEAMLMSNLGAGVQACYRGPRLYDTNDTKAMVKEIIAWFKSHREVLEGDVIHLRRADGQDLDYWLNVNPNGKEKGLLMVYNPLPEKITRKLSIPMYYTGLKDEVRVSIEGSNPVQMQLNRDYSLKIDITVEGKSYTWIVFE